MLQLNNSLEGCVSTRESCLSDYSRFRQQRYQFVAIGHFFINVVYLLWMRKLVIFCC